MSLDDSLYKQASSQKKSDEVKWSSESYDHGTEAEKNLMQFFVKVLELKEFSLEEEKSGTQFEDVRIRKTTKYEDEHKGGDFSLYIPQIKKYIHFDLTTASERETLNYKEKNAEKHNLKVLKLGFRDIELASKRCTKDVNFVYKEIRRQVLGIEA